MKHCNGLFCSEIDFTFQGHPKLTTCSSGRGEGRQLFAIPSLELCCCTSLMSKGSGMGRGSCGTCSAIAVSQRSPRTGLVPVGGMCCLEKRMLWLHCTLDTQQVPGRTMPDPSQRSRIWEEVARTVQVPSLGRVHAPLRDASSGQPPLLPWPASPSQRASRPHPAGSVVLPTGGSQPAQRPLSFKARTGL